MLNANTRRRSILQIAEIISTGTLRRISQVDDLTQTINLFSKVWGAGPHACKKWFAKGYRTLDDLRAHTEDLTKQQLIGLQYFEVRRIGHSAPRMMHCC